MRYDATHFYSTHDLLYTENSTQYFLHRFYYIILHFILHKFCSARDISTRDFLRKWTALEKILIHKLFYTTTITTINFSIHFLGSESTSVFYATRIKESHK